MGDIVVYDEVGDASVSGINIWTDHGGTWNFTHLFWSMGVGTLENNYDGTFETFSARADISTPPAVPLLATAALLPAGVS